MINPVVYDNVNPGLESGLGVWEAIHVLQQALEKHHSQWAQYTWQDSKGEEHGLAEYFWDTSHAQMIGVSPRVFLVTSGLALDWQIPANTDFLDAIDDVGVTLTQHYWDYEFNDDLQSSYPQVANSANYALYAFFDFDQEILAEWCETYIELFGESPLDIPSYDE